MSHRAALLAVAAVLSTGCATTLSTMQTARPVERGHVEVEAGGGLYLPFGSILGAISRGEQQVEKLVAAAGTGQPYAVSEEEQQDLASAAIALAVMPPSANTELALRTGIVDNLDAGLRYSINAVRLDAKYRFFHRGEGPENDLDAQRSTDLAVGFGVSRYLFNNPLVEALQFVQLGDFSRWDFEVPVLGSYEIGQFFRVYGGPKWVYSRTDLDARLVNTSSQASNLSGLDLSLPDVVHSHFVGATLGVMLGYRYVFLIAELTGGYTFCAPVIAGRRRDLGGATLYPALGLALRI